MHEEPRYIRFGKPPRGGYSKDHHTGRLMRGTSCYRGVLQSEKCFSIDMSGLSVPDYALLPQVAMDAPAFFLSGEEIGVGSDGEPLLRVEHCWVVPRDMELTSYQPVAQPALKLWSRGPRNGKGNVIKRLTRDTEYTKTLPTNGFLFDPRWEGKAYASSMRWLSRKKKKRKK